MPKTFSQTLSTVPGTREEQLCRVLHIILILLYVALVIVASQHYEHGLNFPFTSTGQTTLSATVSIISQGFGTVSNAFQRMHRLSLTPLLYSFTSRG